MRAARRTVRRFGVAAVGALLVILMALACSSGNSGRVEGLVVEAVGSGILEIETFSVRDGNGRIWTFVTDGPVGTSASHLRQHQIMGEAITVEYVEAGGRLIATGVKDLGALDHR